MNYCLSIMKFFYRPAYLFLIVDLLLLMLSFYIVLDWFPLTTNTPFNKYSWPSLFYALFWVICSYLFKRYKPLRKQLFVGTSLKLLYITFVVTLFYWIIIHLYFENTFSEFVLNSISIVVFTVNYAVLNIFYAYKYAVEYNDFEIALDKDRVNANVKPTIPLDRDSLAALCATIEEHSGTKVLNFLKNTTCLECGQTQVFASTDALILKYQMQYQYATIVQLEKLNNIRGINKMLAIVNDKLPDNGVFISCFETKSTYKKKLLDKYVKGINYLISGLNFFLKRIIYFFS